MFRLIAVTLAGFLAILYVFGDETRRVEVSRGAGLDFSLSGLIPVTEDAETKAPAPLNGPDESAAVAIALEAGRVLRAERSGNSVAGLMGTGGPVAARPAADPAQATGAVWYVTGSSVNLRAGPGTSNEVVGQLRRGDAAEPLTDTGAAWVEVRTADGLSGWISSQFLSENAPS